MNIFQIARTEFMRMTTSPMRILALIALITIPSLYSGLYLYANEDPYGNMKNVPVAVTVQNEANNPLGLQVAQNLLDSKAFNLEKTDLEDAVKGVENEKYLFAINIPEDFSEGIDSIAAAIQSDKKNFIAPKLASIILITNDANSYLVHTAADTAGDQITRTISGQVSSEITTGFLKSLSLLHDKMGEAANGAQQLSVGMKEVNDKTPQFKDGLNQIMNGSDELAKGLEELDSKTPDFAAGLNSALTGSKLLTDGIGELASKTAALPQLTQQLSDGASQIAAGDKKIADVADKIVTILNELKDAWEDTQKPELLKIIEASNAPQAVKDIIVKVLGSVDKQIITLNTRANEVDKQIDLLASGSGELATGTKKLADSMPALVNAISKLNSGANSLNQGLGKLNTAFAQLQNGVKKLGTGANSLSAGISKLDNAFPELQTGLKKLGKGTDLLAKSLSVGYKQIPNLTEEQQKIAASAVQNPVTIKNSAQATAGGYAQGLMPFFIALSAWVGAYALFILLKPLSSRALAARQNPIRIALGGWLFPTLLGFLQMTLLLLVISFGLKMPPANIPLAIGFLYLMVAAYTAILLCLNAALGKVGTFLGLVLLILQLTSSGGTFPWQTTPEFFHILHAFLPMGYAVDAIRHIFYGANLNPIGLDILVMALYLIGGLAIATAIASKQRTWSLKRLSPEI